MQKRYFHSSETSVNVTFALRITRVQYFMAIANAESGVYKMHFLSMHLRSINSDPAVMRLYNNQMAMPRELWPLIWHQRRSVETGNERKRFYFIFLFLLFLKMLKKQCYSYYSGKQNAFWFPLVLRLVKGHTIMWPGEEGALFISSFSFFTNWSWVFRFIKVGLEKILCTHNLFYTPFLISFGSFDSRMLLKSKV